MVAKIENSDYPCAICHYYDIYNDECMLDAPCPIDLDIEVY